MEICRAIEQRGVRCAIAPRDVPPGYHYPTWIGDAVQKASAFVIVVSRHSQVSKSVLAETEMAFSNDGCPIYPVRIEAIDKRDLAPALHYLIGQRQIFDAIQPMRDSSLRRLSKSVARDVLGRSTGGAKGGPDPLGRDGPYFRKLWARMDSEGRAIGWLWEAALGGPLWCFYRGMNGLGYGFSLGLALTVLIAGLVAGVGNAALVLLLGWLGIAIYLGLIGATLYRRHVATRRAGRNTTSSAGAIPALISIAVIIGALTVSDLVGKMNAELLADDRMVAVAGDPADPVAESGQTAHAATANQRISGDGAAYRAEMAQKERERKLAEKALIVGGAIGYEMGQRDADERQQAEQAARAAEQAASDAREAAGPPAM